MTKDRVEQLDEVETELQNAIKNRVPAIIEVSEGNCEATLRAITAYRHAPVIDAEKIAEKANKIVCGYHGNLIPGEGRNDECNKRLAQLISDSIDAPCVPTKKE